jgi:glycine hydroxymethyltransferase
VLPRLLGLVEQHHEWRSRCLNLVASESPTSPLVRQLLATDLGRRYWAGDVYGGGEYLGQILELTRQLGADLFQAGHVDVRPVTGHMAVLATVIGLAGPGDLVITVDPERGGYPLRIAERYPIRLGFHPMAPDGLTVDGPGAAEQVRRLRPRLVVLGASELLFPHPVAEVARAAREVGATLYFDGAHVLGLIAGHQFQDPLAEGADILTGSTHKSFSGPQGGIILAAAQGRDAQTASSMLDSPSLLQSGYHPNRVAALGVALLEMREFGRAYAAQMVANARELACAMHAQGIPVLGAERRFTRSHQVLLDMGGSYSSPQGFAVKRTLERAGILADAVVRLGVQEITRLGMREDAMVEIAAFVRRLLVEGEPCEQVGRDVAELMTGHRRYHFCFESETAAYESLMAVAR